MKNWKAPKNNRATFFMSDLSDNEISFRKVTFSTVG